MTNTTDTDTLTREAIWATVNDLSDRLQDHRKREAHYKAHGEHTMADVHRRRWKALAAIIGGYRAANRILDA